MSPTWPREMLSTFTLGEQDGKITVNLEWVPLNPTEEERKTFDSSYEGMKQGWGGTFHYCLQSPDGKEMWGKFVHREIAVPERIVCVNSFFDAFRPGENPIWQSSS
jgi:hypothetical protein